MPSTVGFYWGELEYNTERGGEMLIANYKIHGIVSGWLS